MSLFKGLDTPFFDSTTGEPLAFGFVYFGMPNQDAIANPKVPYANQGLSIPLPATQDLTIAGKFQQEVWLDGDYSMIITDANGVQQAEYLVVPQAEGGGGGGASSFTDLDDVPSSYSGQAGKGVRVNSGANGLEFYTPAVDRRAVTAVTSTAGVVAFDYALGDGFTISMSENIVSASVTNPPPAGVLGCIAIRISQDSTPRTFAFPANWQFTDSSPLTTIPTGSGDDALLIMTTFDGGVVWFATMDTLA